MILTKAKSLKIGDTVYCPADRGESGYHGKIIHIGEQVSKNIDGVEFVWITVRKDSKTNHVWPSNRLG